MASEKTSGSWMMWMGTFLISGIAIAAFVLALLSYLAIVDAPPKAPIGARSLFMASDPLTGDMKWVDSVYGLAGQGVVAAPNGINFANETVTSTFRLPHHGNRENSTGLFAENTLQVYQSADIEPVVVDASVDDGEILVSRGGLVTQFTQKSNLNESPMTQITGSLVFETSGETVTPKIVGLTLPAATTAYGTVYMVNGSTSTNPVMSRQVVVQSDSILFYENQLVNGVVRRVPLTVNDANAQEDVGGNNYVQIHFFVSYIVNVATDVGISVSSSAVAL